MTDDWASGFRLDGILHPWGTAFEAAAPGRVDRGYASVALPCREAYGFATRYAQPSAPRPDRPVTAVAYELADTGAAPRMLFAQLVIRLGQPDTVDRSEPPASGDASDSVVLYARWRRDKIGIGLSLYGAPRPSDFGDGLGKLYLSWDDTAAAAAPFIAAWTAASRAVEEAATGVAPRILTLAYPLYDRDDPQPSARERALATPELLPTPLAIADRLGPTTFALWSDTAGLRWHLSTARSTVRLGEPETRVVRLQEIAPARGGGFSALDVGSWFVRDTFESAALREAVEILEKVPGVAIERHTGHDV